MASDGDGKMFCRTAQVAMVIRVDDPVGPPFALKGSQLAGEPGCANRIAIKPARDGFVMDQDSTRLVKRLPSLLIQPQAKIHIVKCDGEVLFIQTTDSLEAAFLHNEASGGYG